jgi:hypothetical protein
MAEKLRKMVMKRTAVCDRVVGAARVQGPGIGEKLGVFLSPALREGEELPDLTAVIDLYGRRLEGFRDEMVAADGDYLTQRAMLADLTLESEIPTGKVKSSILSLRATCEGLLGRNVLRSLGLDFLLAQEPQGVLRQSEIIRERLLSSDSELMPERWLRNPLVREELATELDREIAELRLMVQRLVEQRKAVDTAKVRKDQTQEEFDRQFIPLARVLEATFRVAGETELADRIRPTVRQLGRDGGEDEEPTEPEATEPEVPPASEPEAAEEAAPAP